MLSLQQQPRRIWRGVCERCSWETTRMPAVLATLQPGAPTISSPPPAGGLTQTPNSRCFEWPSVNTSPNAHACQKSTPLGELHTNAIPSPMHLAHIFGGDLQSQWYTWTFLSVSFFQVVQAQGPHRMNSEIRVGVAAAEAAAAVGVSAGGGSGASMRGGGGSGGRRGRRQAAAAPGGAGPRGRRQVHAHGPPPLRAWVRQSWSSMWAICSVGICLTEEIPPARHGPFSRAAGRPVKIEVGTGTTHCIL